jgi:pimeloyl-ACP methyl ester carboxylesterase
LKAKLNGINIYYEVHGNGEPLVLIAGLIAHSQNWKYQLSKLKNNYKVILHDSIKHSDWICVHNSGHGLHNEQPDKYNELILNFLS